MSGADVFGVGAEVLGLMYQTKRLPGDRKHVLLACFPKSGSTYLATLIAAAGGYAQLHLSDGVKGGEHEPSASRMFMHHRADYVTQLHVRCSQGTAVMIEKFSLLPVVLYRDLFDTVVSMKDDLRNDDFQYVVYGSPFPISYIPASVKDLDDDGLLSYVVDMLVPWYLAFYASWQRYSGRKLCVSYREVTVETPKVLSAISDHFQLRWSAAAIAAAIAGAQGADTRKNKAVAGRGQALGEQHKERITKLSRYYPGIDFGPIGL